MPWNSSIFIYFNFTIPFSSILCWSSQKWTKEDEENQEGSRTTLQINMDVCNRRFLIFRFLTVCVFLFERNEKHLWNDLILVSAIWKHKSGIRSIPWNHLYKSYWLYKKMFCVATLISIFKLNLTSSAFLDIHSSENFQKQRLPNEPILCPKWDSNLFRAVKLNIPATLEMEVKSNIAS